MAELTYRQMLDRYDRAKAFGEKRSLPEYAQHLNELYQTQNFSAGLRDGPWTRASTRLDQELESVFGPALGPLGESIGGVFGHPAAGKQVALGLPRAIAQTAPLYLLGPQAGLPATAAALAGTGALFGAQTYADTGSPKAALISGAAAAVTPPVGRLTGNLGARAFGGQKVVGEIGSRAFNEVLPKVAKDVAKVQAGRFAGSQIGQAAVQAKATQWQEQAMGRDVGFVDALTSPEFLLGQIPFTVYDAVSLAKSRTPTVAEVSPTLNKPKAPIAEFKPTQVDAQAQAQLDSLLTTFDSVARDPNATPEARAAALRNLVGNINDPDSVAKAHEVRMAAAARPTVEAPVKLTGRVDKIGDSYRVLVDEIETPFQTTVQPGQTVFVNGAEPTFDPETGRMVFETQIKNLAPAKRALSEEDFGVQPTEWDVQQPELTVQPPPEGTAPEVINAQADALQARVQALRPKPSADEFVPAIKVGEQTIVGKKGDTHKDILQRHLAANPDDADALLNFDTKENPNFFVRQGQPVSREQLQQTLGVRDSQGLRELQTKAEVPKITSPEVATLREMRVPERQIARIGQNVPKVGDPVLDWFQGRINLDPEGKVVRLGTTDVGVSGLMNEARFANATQLPKAFVDAMKLAYPEAFQGGKVNVNELFKGLKERPMVEVKKFSSAEVAHEAKREQAVHELDTRFPGWQTRSRDQMQPQERELFELTEGPTTTEIQDAGARFSFLGPKAETEMPGYVECLVRVPNATRKTKEISSGGVKMIAPDEFDAPLYSGPHFGSEDTNVLAFFRGYEEALPDGRKAFHVIEVQSDWAQGARKRADHEAGPNARQPFPEGAKNIQPHPLLAVYETLALKAAIQHAREVGADAVMLSDAETAMMTEGHDRVPNELSRNGAKIGDWVAYKKGGHPVHDWKMYAKSEEELSAKLADYGDGQQYDKKQITDAELNAEPSQSGGMRLHYDTTLPSAMKKLTGQEGQRIEVGVHDKAKSEVVEGMVNGSPVFREPSGTPKSTITGRLYPLNKIAGGLAADPTLSIKEAVMKYEQAQQKQAQAREQVSAVPTRPDEWAQLVDVPTAKPRVDAAQADGATPAQAVEAVRLQDQTKIVDESMLDESVQEDVVHATVSEGFYGEQSQFGSAVLDEQGNRRIWRNPAEAEAYASANLEGDYRVRNDGRGFYYLAPKENIMVQFEGEGGLEGVLAQPAAEAQMENLGRREAIESELAATPADERPDISRQAMLTSLDVAGRSPDTFAEFVDSDIVDDTPANMVTKARITLQKGTEGLEAVNAELRSRGIEPFKSMTEMTTQMRELMRAASMFEERFRNVTLGSTVPGDPALLVAYGMDKGVDGLARHIAQQKAMGPVADIMEAIVNSGVLPKDTILQLPGMPGHDAGDGWWMSQGVEGILPAKLNVPFFPAAPNDPAYLLNAAHEIVHVTEEGLAARTDPGAVEYRARRDEALEALRGTKAVPQKVRATVDKLVKDKAYEKLVRGTMSSDELRTQILKGIGKENRDLFSYVYAMLNPRELSATLFTDPRLIAIADTTPMKKGIVESALNFLSKAFNRLIGGTPKTETALSTMLKAYDNYLTGGIMRKVYNGGKFVRDSLVQAGVRPEALASRMQTIDRTFVRGTLDASVAGFQREAAAGTLPATAHVGELAPDFLTSLRAPEPASAYDATMNLLADQLPQHQELFWRMRQDIKTTEALVHAVEKGEITATLPPGVKSALGLSKAKLNNIEKAMRKQELALARWSNLDSFDPMGWEQRVAEGLTERIRNVEPPDEVPDAAEVRKLMGVEKLYRGPVDKVKNWLSSNFMLTQHLKEVMPETRPIISGVNDEQGKAHSRAVLLNGAYIYDPATQNLNPELKKSNDRVAESPALSEAASDLFRWQNREGGAQGIDMRAPEVVKILSRFNAKDRTAILNLLRAQWQRHHVWADTVLPPAMGEINRDNTGLLIGARETGMLPDQARKLSTEMYEALRVLADPTQGAVGSEMLRNLATKMSPETFYAALKHAQTLSENTANWIKRIRDNPGYTTEQRYGSDKLVMLAPTGDKFMTSGDQAKLQKIQSEKAAQGYTLLDYIRAEDAKSPTFGMREDMLNALEQLDAQNEVLVAELLKDQPETAARILPRIQRAGDIRASISAGSPMPVVKRRFVEGREYLNLVDNANQFYVRMNNWLRNKATRARTQLDMTHPQIEGNTEVRNLMEQHVNNFLSPDNPMARKLVEATYFYKLAFDVGNSMLEGTQNLTTGMSALIGETGSVGDAFGLWGKAVKEITQHKATKKWANPEHERLMDRAATQGHQGMATWSDIVDPDTNTVLDAQAGTASSAVGAVKNAAKRWSSMFTKFNDQIALIAAFDLGKSKGMDFEQAYSFAVDVKQRGLFTGGKGQRPIGLWSIKSKPVPQLLSALQTYSLGWFSQMAENYTKGFGKAPEGLTATQRLGAKKAFIYSIIAQAALAGALGLPGVGQGLALLGQATDTDPKGWLRQNLASLFEEDQQAGGVMTSLALRGVGSAGLPFDPSSRASVSVPFLGIDAYKGFDVANLGGAATSTMADFVEGLMGMLKGDLTAASKLLPNVAKRPFQLWQGEGDIRDKRGGLLVELSPAERFAMALGVTPSRVQTQRDTSDALNKANRAATRQKEAFVDELASLTRQGKTSEVQQALTKYIQEHPGEDVKQLVRTIAARVEAQSVAYDWRRDLNPGVELAGLTSSQPSQELARRKLREQVMLSLGVVPTLNAREDYRAAMIDQLLDSNPLLTRREARQAVSAKPTVQSPYTWLAN